MQLSELKFEWREPYSHERAKLRLGGGCRLYMYRYRDADGMAILNDFTIYLNSGPKSGGPIQSWISVDILTAQCVLHDAVETYGLCGTPWWELLWNWWRS